MDADTCNGDKLVHFISLQALSFFMSEVWRIKTQAKPFFDSCFGNAKIGSLFLFVDNNASEFYGWFDSMAKAHNLKIIESRERTMAFSNDEEKNDVEPYFRKFGWPKRESNLAYRVCRKEKA